MDFSDSNQHLEVLKACARVFINRMCERFRLGGFKTPVPIRFRGTIRLDEIKGVIDGFYQCCYEVYEREDPVGDETPYGEYWARTRAGYLVWYRACNEPAVLFDNVNTIDQCTIDFTEKLDQAEADR